MPVNAFLIQGNMTKHKTLPFYETCVLNYDIRRRTNPVKVREFMLQQGTIRPVMHAGSLWEKIKNGFKKLKNGLTKTMDFVDNNEVLKNLKDSALDYVGNKTGIDMKNIYDTTHKVMDAIPQFDTSQPVDEVAYFNQRQQMYGQNPVSYDYNSSYSYPYNNSSYSYNNSYPGQNNYSYNNSSYSYPTPSNNNSSFTSQLNNTYQQIQKQPLSEPQKQQVKANFDLFSSGLKSCGEDIRTALTRNQTIMKNIPKMLMMGMTAKGNLSVHKSFKPILEKFGHHSLIVPKTIKSMLDKLNIPIDRFRKNPVDADINEPIKDRLKKVATQASNASANANGRLHLGGTNGANEIGGRLNLGRGPNETGHANVARTTTMKTNLSSTNNTTNNQIKPNSAGKKSRYADILAKLSSR